MARRGRTRRLVALGGVVLAIATGCHGVAVAPAPMFEEAAPDPADAPGRLDAALSRIATEVQPAGSKFQALRAVTGPTLAEEAWPTGEVARLGLVFAIRRSQPIERSAWQTLQVGRLVWDSTTRSASLDRFSAGGEGSTRLLGEVSQAVSRWLRGENADVVVPAAASRYLDAEITGATTVVRAGSDATGASSTPGAVARVVRRVQGPSGPLWLLWEDLPGGGILGVFPDVDPRAPVGPQDGIVAPSRPDGPPAPPMSRAPGPSPGANAPGPSPGANAPGPSPGANAPGPSPGANAPRPSPGAVAPR